MCEHDCEVERIGMHHRWRAVKLIRNRVSQNRFRSDDLARACGPSRYYVGKLIILLIMPDLPQKGVTYPMARAVQELLSLPILRALSTIFSFHADAAD